MGNLTVSQATNIRTPDGNSLAVFIDGVTGIMKLKDALGNVQPLSDFIGTPSPFEYGTGSESIQPILGNNVASGLKSSIGGGYNNTASDNFTTIGGGIFNTASCGSSTVGGGGYNTASGEYSTVSGGRYNCSTNRFSNIGGGSFNTVSSLYSVIGGGRMNNASSYFSSISGGVCNNTCGYCNTHILGSNICATQADTTFTNCISAQNLTSGCAVQVGANNVLISVPTTPSLNNIFIIGSGTGSTERCGLSNQAIGNYSVVTGGKFNSAYGNFSTISGGICNCTYSDFDTIAGGQHNVTLSCYSIIGGGSYNTTSGNNSSISGGFCNSASNSFSIIGGGENNISSALCSIVGGGSCNIASAEHSFVGGGYCNNSSAIHGSITGGAYNNISGCYSIIGGGCSNIVSSNFSGIVGGVNNNTCTFANSMIVGSNLCATQACTTFMNCASVDNLTTGCFVRVGANKVLQNASFTPVLPRFGSFYSNQTQSPTTINTPKAVTLNNTDIASDGVSIVSGSKITVDTTGVYNLQFSAQLNRTTGGTDEQLDIWYRINGVQVSNTATGVNVKANSKKAVLSWNFFIPLTAGQNVELMYSSTDLDIQFLAEVENLIVPYPAIPSFIVTMNKIS